MWTFDSSTGWLTTGGNLVEKGYAGGNLGLAPWAINSKLYQYTPKVGPLPVGLYTMGTAVEGSHLGPLAIPLTPDPSNDMRGRSGFFVHGDTTPSGRASEGCVILSRATREKMCNSQDHQLRVV